MGKYIEKCSFSIRLDEAETEESFSLNFGNDNS